MPVASSPSPEIAFETYCSGSRTRPCHRFATPWRNVSPQLRSGRNRFNRQFVQVARRATPRQRLAAYSPWLGADRQLVRAGATLGATSSGSVSPCPGRPARASFLDRRARGIRVSAVAPQQISANRPHAVTGFERFLTFLSRSRTERRHRGHVYPWGSVPSMWSTRGAHDEIDVTHAAGLSGRDS